MTTETSMTAFLGIESNKASYAAETINRKVEYRCVTQRTWEAKHTSHLVRLIPSRGNNKGGLTLKTLGTRGFGNNIHSEQISALRGRPKSKC